MKIYDLVESPLKPVVEPFLGKKHSKKGSKKPYIYSTFFYPIFLIYLFIFSVNGTLSTSQKSTFHWLNVRLRQTLHISISNNQLFQTSALTSFFLFYIFRISQIIRYNHNYVLHIILIMWERKGIQNMIQFKFKF